MGSKQAEEQEPQVKKIVKKGNKAEEYKAKGLQKQSHVGQTPEKADEQM